jgi:ADP-ribosyl-[dinitrogen reductase] hydrolase
MVTLVFPGPYEGTLPHRIPLVWPAAHQLHSTTNSRIVGSLVGLAVGDALGASVEFQTRRYMIEHPVHTMMSGGTWGLRAGQWTDDTSMALCLASSLISQRTFNPYDQMVRYKWWYRHGYLSSTGKCFDIGNATRAAIEEFSRRQHQLNRQRLPFLDEPSIDLLPIERIRKFRFDVNCSQPGALGNGALMRIAPVPLFYHDQPRLAVELAGESARLTHGDEIAIDGCRYYAALIVAAVHGETKENLLRQDFVQVHRAWFADKDLHHSVFNISKGSYKQARGYDDRIRGKGDTLSSLEAALWAFWSGTSFEHGALNAVNLGDDTDTVAAIYGQLAGAHYQYERIPQRWKKQLYAHDLIVCIGQWLQAANDRQHRSDSRYMSNFRQMHSVDGHRRSALMSTRAWPMSFPVVHRRLTRAANDRRHFM